MKQLMYKNDKTMITRKLRTNEKMIHWNFTGTLCVKRHHMQRYFVVGEHKNGFKMERCQDTNAKRVAFKEGE